MFIFLTYNTLPPMSVHKKFSPIGLAVWPAIGNIYMYDRMSCFIIFIWSMETSAQDYF